MHCFSTVEQCITSNFIYQASSSHETMIKRITEAFHLPHLSLLTSSYKLKPIHWFRHMFCRLHVAYILYYKHYQLKYLRVSPIDTRPIYFRFNKTESSLVIYLIRELLPLVGNETDSSVVWR